MEDWLIRHSPVWLHRTIHWFGQPEVLFVVTLASVVLFVASIVGVPWFVARMPADYFSRRERRELGIVSRRRPLVIALRVLKNAFGLVLLVSGVLMLFLPGQGLLTIAVSLLLLDFPGKHRLQRRLIGYKPIYSSLNKMRERAGRPPLQRGSWM